MLIYGSYPRGLDLDDLATAHIGPDGRILTISTTEFDQSLFFNEPK